MTVRRTSRPGFYQVTCRCRTIEWDSAEGAGIVLNCKRCHVRNFVPGPIAPPPSDGHPKTVRATIADRFY